MEVVGKKPEWRAEVEFYAEGVVLTIDISFNKEVSQWGPYCISGGDGSKCLSVHVRKNHVVTRLRGRDNLKRVKSALRPGTALTLYGLSDLSPEPASQAEIFTSDPHAR
jgi:hypothetical protein